MQTENRRKTNDNLFTGSRHAPSIMPKSFQRGVHVQPTSPMWWRGTIRGNGKMSHNSWASFALLPPHRMSMLRVIKSPKDIHHHISCPLQSYPVKSLQKGGFCERGIWGLSQWEERQLSGEGRNLLFPMPQASKWMWDIFDTLMQLSPIERCALINRPNSLDKVIKNPDSWGRSANQLYPKHPKIK